MNHPYRVIVAAEHAVIRQGLKKILREKPGFEIIGEARDGSELLKRIAGMSPDMIILDISMPKLRGIEAISEVKKIYAHTKVLVLSIHEEIEFAYQAFSAGADGYVLKEDPIDQLLSAIETLRHNKVFISPVLSEEFEGDWLEFIRGDRNGRLSKSLTPRQREILKLIAEGRSNKEIANKLFISVHTVERHRANIMTKLRLKGKGHLLRYAVRHSYL